MKEYTKDQLDAINSFLDTKTQDEMLAILADPKGEIQVRFSTVFRSHMDQGLACKVCEKIAVNREDSRNARMIALTMVRPVSLGNELAKAIALDPTEEPDFRMEMLFDYPYFTTEITEKLVEQILNNRNETTEFKALLSGFLLKFANSALSQGAVKASA